MNNSSFITDKINSFLAKSQEFLRPLVSASLFLQRFDYLILLLMILLLAVSLFANTKVIGIVAGAIIVFTVLKLFFIRGQDIKIYPSNLLLIGFLAICLISAFFSAYVASSLKTGFLYYFLYISFYFSMVQFFRFNKNKMVPIIFIMMFFVAFEAGVAMLQSMAPFEAVSSWQDTSYVNDEDILSRVYGTLKPYNPNLLCGYLLIGLSSVFTVGLWSFLLKHKKTLIFSLGVIILTLYAIFATGTRSGYLGLFTAIIVGFMLVNKILKIDFSQKAQNLWKKICTGFFAFMGIFIVLKPSLLKRILSIFVMRQDSSTSFRMNVYGSVWQMFKDNWFSGIGAGHDTFREVYALYMKTTYTALSAYSIYLEIAVECGIFALLFVILFFVSIVKSALKILQGEAQLEQKAIIASILIMMTAVFTQGFFDTLFFRPQLQFLFWTNIAMMSVILHENKDYKINNVEQIIMELSDFVKDKTEKFTKGA